MSLMKTRGLNLSNLSSDFTSKVTKMTDFSDSDDDLFD